MQFRISTIAIVFVFSALDATLTDEREQSVVGYWRFDVAATIKATKAAKNPDAIASLTHVNPGVECQFRSDGTFSWHHPRSGKSTSYSGTWTAKKKAKKRMHVHLAYPSASNEVDAVVSRKTHQLTFSSEYPVCVFRRITIN